MDNISQSEKIAKPTSETPKFKELFLSFQSAYTVQSFALVTLLSLAIIYTLYFSRTIFLPIIFAFIFKFLLSPLVKALNKIYIPYKIGAAIVLLMLISIIVYSFYHLAIPALDWIEKGPQIISQVEKKLTKMIEPIKKPIEELSKISDRITELNKIKLSKEVSPTVNIRQPSFFTTLISNTWGGIIELGITLILLYFLLATGDDFLKGLIKLFSTLSKKKEIVTIAREAERMVAIYLLTIACINFTIGLIVTLLMYFFHMPNPLLWGVMAGTLEFIPYLGVLIGIFTIAIVAIFTFDSLFLITVVPLSYYLISSFISGIITPFILGNSFLLNPVLVFLAIIIGGVLWGILGVLVAVPIAVIIKIVFENINTTPQVEEILNKDK